MHRLDLKKRDWLTEQADPHGYGFKFWVSQQTYAWDDESSDAVEIREGRPVYVVYRHRETVFALPRWTHPYVEVEVQREAERRAKEERQDITELGSFSMVTEAPFFRKVIKQVSPGQVHIFPPVRSLAELTERYAAGQVHLQGIDVKVKSPEEPSDGA